MSPCYLKCSAVTVLVLALAAWGAPTHGPLSMDLSEVLNKTTCPIRVHIDENEQRIPRLIKTLTCDTKPTAVCEQSSTAHACCHHRHPEFSTHCVEVLDNVLVHYKDRPEPEVISVPVGCTCMIREGTPALDAQ